MKYDISEPMELAMDKILNAPTKQLKRRRRRVDPIPLIFEEEDEKAAAAAAAAAAVEEFPPEKKKKKQEKEKVPPETPLPERGSAIATLIPNAPSCSRFRQIYVLNIRPFPRL